MRKWIFSFQRLLYRPEKVFLVCVVFATTSLVVNGSLLRLWGLHRDHQKLEDSIVATKSEIRSLDGQLLQAKDPAFIERQARDKFDLAGEHDLVFFFSDE